MSEILREKQKAEALKRMRLMGLREDFIRDFEEDGKVLLSLSRFLRQGRC